MFDMNERMTTVESVLQPQDESDDEENISPPSEKGTETLSTSKSAKSRELAALGNTSGQEEKDLPKSGRSGSHKAKKKRKGGDISGDVEGLDTKRQKHK